MTGYIETLSHEFSVHYNYAEPGLALYFAAHSIVQTGDGSRRSPFTLERALDSDCHSAIREFELIVRRYPDGDPTGQ